MGSDCCDSSRQVWHGGGYSSQLYPVRVGPHRPHQTEQLHVGARHTSSVFSYLGCPSYALRRPRGLVHTVHKRRFNSTVGGLDLWFTHMLTVGGRDLWFTHALNFVVKWTLEGTNATHNLPYRLHKSATPSPKATYTPNFQNPFRHACPVTVKNIGLKL